ncbi:MAG: 6-carboxytetrahydropterin synthase QueD [Candidatus Omnitrophica bacterium]|nr:6-carboxytetrahydropterin synthase QueD [Candidatus Omnitrophota bacterium]
MYEVKVRAQFSAAHNLRGYLGKCEQLHGHNWKVEAVIRGERLDKIGMLVDFKLVKSKLNSILEGLDHKHLNRLSYFKKIYPARNKKSSKRKGKISNGVNPTSENIAKYIYIKLHPKVSGLISLKVWESDSSSATYYGI